MTNSTPQQRQADFDAAIAVIRATVSGQADLAELRNICTNRAFEDLRRVLHLHGMLGRCTPLLGKLGFLTPEQTEKLQRRARRTITRRLQILALGRRIGGLLDRDDIRHVHLKGFGLSQRLFGDPVARNFTDIDILISPRDIMRADQLLKAEGFRPANDLAAMPERQRHMFCALQHDVTYRDPESDVSIEVHWRFNRTRPLSSEQFDQLYARREMVEIGGWPAPCLSLADEAAYLIDHGVKHGWLRLKWLYDIHALLEREGASVFADIDKVPGLGTGPENLRTAAALCQAYFGGDGISDDAAEPDISGFMRMIARQDLHLPLGADPDVALQLMRNKSLRDRLYGLLPSLMNTYAWGNQRPPLGWWPLFVLTGPASWLTRKGLLKGP